jgi:hypothetical protein
MAVEEVKDQNFREEIKTSPPKQACHQHLTLFFRPPPQVAGVGSGGGWPWVKCWQTMP